VWTLITGTRTVKKTTYFRVARRRFESQVTDNDLLELEAHIEPPAGVADFSSWIKAAWRKIEAQVWKKIRQYPGDVFFPERFFDAHVNLALAQFFRSNAFEESSEDWSKFKSYMADANVFMDMAFANVDLDTNDDGKVAEDEKGKTFVQPRFSR
jgi:hypothetical protein